MTNLEPVHGVTVSKLVKTFGATAALRGVDLELKAGELTLIEGANGSGKSTLLRIVGTILSPTSGHISYQPLGRDVMKVRSQLGWLSHESLAYGDLSGRAKIELAARLHGLEPKAAYEKMRDRFALGRFAERRLRTNSRGQRQRIALARALVHEPTLVLLDEPTTGLDKAGIKRLMKVIDQELASNAVVAVVTHEPAVFEDRDSRRIVLERGRVVAGGTAASGA